MSNQRLASVKAAVKQQIMHFPIKGSEAQELPAFIETLLALGQRAMLNVEFCLTQTNMFCLSTENLGNKLWKLTWNIETEI